MGMKFLNKKGWHTGSMQNVERVWKAEQKHEAEQKKMEELKKQITEERAKAEFRELQEKAGIIQRQERLEFLYDSGMSVGKPTTEEYLLGKPLEEPKEEAVLKKMESVPGALFSEDKPTSANETWRKIHTDPLFLIRQQEQAALQKIRNNPLQMELLKKKAEVKKSKREQKAEKRRLKEERRAKRKARKERKAEKRAKQKCKSPSDTSGSSSSSSEDDSSDDGRVRAKASPEAHARFGRGSGEARAVPENVRSGAASEPRKAEPEKGRPHEAGSDRGGRGRMEGSRSGGGSEEVRGRTKRLRTQEGVEEGRGGREETFRSGEGLDVGRGGGTERFRSGGGLEGREGRGALGGSRFRVEEEALGEGQRRDGRGGDVRLRADRFEDGRGGDAKGERRGEVGDRHVRESEGRRERLRRSIEREGGRGGTRGGERRDELQGYDDRRDDRYLHSERGEPDGGYGRGR